MAEYQNNFYPREGVIVAYYNFGILSAGISAE